VVIVAVVIGVCTALFAARDGLKVVLLEKGRVAGEQSSRNWGWIRVQGRDYAEVPIAVKAQELWQELAGQLDTDIGLKQMGVAYLATDEADAQRFDRFRKLAKEHNLSTKLLDRGATGELFSHAAKSWHSALYTPTDMRAEPFLAVPAIVRLAAKEGVTILEGCAVRGLEQTRGAVSGVVTEKGVVKAPQVVVAAGAWSSLFLRRHGINLAQLSVRATACQTDPLKDVFDGGAVGGGDVAFRRRADGGYTLAPGGFHEFMIGPDAFRALRAYLPQLRRDPFGPSYLPWAPKGYPDAWSTKRQWRDDEVTPFERMRVLNPKPHMKTVHAFCRAFEETFPSVGKVGIKRAWAGMIDSTPDVVPYVDEVREMPGLIVATGMSGHGFGIGPAFGQIVAGLAAGRTPDFDLTRFRLNRFKDGSKIELGPSL